MHSQELIELAAIVSANGPVLVRESGPLSPSSMEKYWVASKCRLDRWSRTLKHFVKNSPNSTPQWAENNWPSLQGTIEEILAGEVLARVWAAVTTAHDRQRETSHAEPITRSILIGHLEARHRVLTLLVRETGIRTEDAVRLNRLRKRIEGWTDTLVGYVSGEHNVSEFAIDPERARDFAEDLRHRSHMKGGRHVWPLLLGSMRAAFGRSLGPISPNADLNAKIANSVVACFRPELFNATGLFRSLWIVRLTNTASDTQGMLDELQALDFPSSRLPDSKRFANRID